MTFSGQRTVHRDQQVKTQPSHKPVGTFPILQPSVHVDLRTTLYHVSLFRGCSAGWRLRSLPQLQAPLCPPPSLFFLSDSLSFPVSSSHLLPARPFSSPSPQHSCCLAYSIYSGIFRVITIKLLKGDNPPEEARLTSSPILSLAWCSPAPRFPEPSCSHLTPHASSQLASFALAGMRLRDPQRTNCPEGLYRSDLCLLGGDKAGDSK